MLHKEADVATLLDENNQLTPLPRARPDPASTAYAPPPAVDTAPPSSLMDNALRTQQQGDAAKLTSDAMIAPSTTEFDESKGVAGRVNSLVSQDNPLMQTAQTRAAQAANARGLRNSSTAVQAGQQAVIETATPIASADAQLFQQQALTDRKSVV